MSRFARPRLLVAMAAAAGLLTACGSSPSDGPGSPTEPCTQAHQEYHDGVKVTLCDHYGPTAQPTVTVTVAP